MLEALLSHVEVVHAYDGNFVSTSDVRTTLFAQSAAFDTLLAPAPIGPVRDAVELYVGGRRLLW